MELSRFDLIFEKETRTTTKVLKKQMEKDYGEFL